MSKFCHFSGSQFATHWPLKAASFHQKKKSYLENLLSSSMDLSPEKIPDIIIVAPMFRDMLVLELQKANLRTGAVSSMVRIAVKVMGEEKLERSDDDFP